MALSVPERPSFSGHESFPFRYGWLKKGIDAIDADPSALSRADAMVELGVGKNMVQSIRHWLCALGLAERMAPDEKGDSRLQATALGKLLFREPGWDPYLEHDGTLWLLHLQLVTNPSGATTWWWAFHRPDTATLRREHLVSEISKFALDNDWRVSRATLKRDVDCLVRSYLPMTRAALTPEDAYAVPLTSLELIQTTLDRDEYILSRGFHSSLPAEIFAVSTSRYLRTLPRREGDSRTIPLARLFLDEFSPGRVFRLTEDALVDRLANLPLPARDAWQYDETAGMYQLVTTGAVDEIELLRSYYERRSLTSEAA